MITREHRKAEARRRMIETFGLASLIIFSDILIVGIVFWDFWSNRKLEILAAALAIQIVFAVYYFRYQNLNNRKNTNMAIITFFAGMQALAAFLQIWQTERNISKATKAYDRAKEAALNDPRVKERAIRLTQAIRNNAVLGRIVRNRFGRCEDVFEEALREAGEEELDAAARAFVRCKCLLLQAIKTAQGGKLEQDLGEMWDELKCDLVLRAR